MFMHWPSAADVVLVTVVGATVDLFTRERALWDDG
jgi:hypothetical protein